MIQEFLYSLNNHRYWQLCKVEDYLVTLHDHIFWQSNEFYSEIEKITTIRLWPLRIFLTTLPTKIFYLPPTLIFF